MMDAVKDCIAVCRLVRNEVSAVLALVKIVVACACCAVVRVNCSVNRSTRCWIMVAGSGGVPRCANRVAAERAIVAVRLASFIVFFELLTDVTPKFTASLLNLPLKIVNLSFQAITVRYIAAYEQR